MSPQGDTLTLSNLVDSPVDSGGWTTCQPSPLLPGYTYGFCADVQLWDAITGAQTTTTNSQLDIEYDACENEVSSGSTGNWYIDGSDPMYMASSTITGYEETIPTSGVCYGTWTVIYSYSQTFTDGETLSATLSLDYQVYATATDEYLAQNPQPEPWDGSVDPLEELGGCPCGLPSHASVTGYPVDTASGNFWHTFDDLSVPGRGPALDLTRTYNSLAAGTDSPFGYGWTDSYGISLSIGMTVVVVHEANGAQATFQAVSGGWVAEFRVPATLVQNADGTWTFTRHAQEVYTFDESGRLTGIADLNGYRTTVSYPSASTMVVTDPAGRSLTFTYTGSHVTSVQDSSSPARTLSYSYDTAGDLSDVIDVGGGHWQFTYDSAHRMLTMRSPRFYDDTSTAPTPVVTNHYDADGRVDRQSDPLGRVTSFDYTSTPNSTKVTDPAGNVTVYGYDYGLLTSQTVSPGTPEEKAWYYRYDPQTIGRTVEIDPNGNFTRQTYDYDGDVTSVTNPLYETTHYTYNNLDEVTSITEAKQVNNQPITTTLTYDSHGNLLTRSAPLLNDISGSVTTTATTTYHHDDPAHPDDVTSVTDPAGHTATYTFDAYGDETSSTDPTGDTTTYGYDTDRGLRTSMVSARGNAAGADPAAYTTTYGYDAYGRLTLTKDPLWTSAAPAKHETVQHYDADGNLDSSTDADGNTTTYSYDPAGERTATHRPDGSTLRTDYWPDGTVHHQYDAAGQATSYAYDGLGHLTSATDPLGRTTQFAYDALGNLLTKTDPAGRTTTYAYDRNSQVSSISYSDGITHSVTFGYDADGQRTLMVDGSGTSTWAYDSLHRMTSYTNGAGQTVGYHYGIAGQLTAIDYPGAIGTVSRDYDSANRLTAVTDWNDHRTTFAYDADGNLTTETYPNGTTATSSHDATGAVTAISDAPTGDPTAPFASFDYGRDGAGQLTSAAATGVPGGNHSYGYDPLERLTAVDSTNYRYDDADNLTTRPDGTQQVFDAADELTAATSGPAISLVGTASAGDSTSSSLSLTLPAGTAAGDQILVAATLPNSKSVTTPTGYTVVGTYTSGTSNSSAKLVLYRRTAVAGDTSVTLGFQGKISKTVVLAVYRGVQPTIPVDVTSSGATAAGTSVTAPSANTTAPGDRLVMLAGASGSAGTWAMPATMTTRVQKTGGSTDTAIADQALTGPGPTGSRVGTHNVSTQLVGVLVALRPAQYSYGYDPQGNRVSVTPPTGNQISLGYNQADQLTSYGSAASYSYNGDGLRTSKTVSGTTTPYTWDTTGSLPLLLADGGTDYIYGPGGLPIEQVSTSGTLYYHQDQLGSTRALTDATGAVVATYSYDPYGNLTASTGTATNPLRYAGQYVDAESGFYYLRARDYDPASGQFLSRDPLTATSRAPYGYADLNPLNADDPLGLFSLGKIAQYVTTVAVVVGGVAACVETACTADLIGAAVAESTEEEAALSEAVDTAETDTATSTEEATTTTSRIAGTTEKAANAVGKGATIVGGSADGIDALHTCEREGWSRECAAKVITATLEGAAAGFDRLIPENTLKKAAYEMNSTMALNAVNQLIDEPCDNASVR